MSYTQVGSCPKCGAPRWSPSVWNGIIPPPSTPSCDCFPQQGTITINETTIPHINAPPTTPWTSITVVGEGIPKAREQVMQVEALTHELEKARKQVSELQKSLAEKEEHNRYLSDACDGYLQDCKDMNEEYVKLAAENGQALNQLRHNGVNLKEYHAAQAEVRRWKNMCNDAWRDRDAATNKLKTIKNMLDMCEVFPGTNVTALYIQNLRSILQQVEGGNDRTNGG